MATVAHLNILKSGPDVWNQWREMNPGVRPDLCEVKLKGDHLRMFNLSRFNLSYANLHWAWMYETNLIEVNLQGADLRGANLALSLLHQANLRQANLSEANLSDADLFKANLRQAKLIKADLSGSRLEGANLNGAELEGADLSLSNLKGAQTKKGGRMFGSFPQQAFYNLLTRLATTSGPSLQEEPRRLVLEEFFNEADVPYDLDAVSNLWVSLGPEGWSEAVVYDAHLDVVERGYTDKVSYDNGRMIGMGVGDDLAAVTMMAFAAKAITAQKMPLKRALRLLFSVGEEGIGNLKGIRQVVSDYPEPPYLFIAFDLSFETYSITALGSKRYRVEVKCPGGHS